MRWVRGVLAPFSGMTPTGNQAIGMFFGSGNQDNFVQLALVANGGAPGVRSGLPACARRSENRSEVGREAVMSRGGGLDLRPEWFQRTL